MTQLLQPSNVHWCTGTDDESDELCDLMVTSGSMIRLNKDLRENSYLVRTDPNDTARDEARSYVCTNTPEEAGPLNNWAPPKETKEKFLELFKGAMKGRTMYVIVYSIGPLGSPYSRYGVQVTDSLYVVLNTRIQARMGTQVLNVLPSDCGDFFKCVHSVGKPLAEGEKDVAWPCNLEKTCIAYFADSDTDNYQMMSYGSAWVRDLFFFLVNGKKNHAIFFSLFMKLLVFV